MGSRSPRTRREVLDAAGLAAAAFAAGPAAAAAPVPLDLSGWRNVRHFGAKGDGRADDSAAIRAALEGLPRSGSNPVGGIFFPAGTYRLSRMAGRNCCIAPSPDHEITLAGVGSGSVLTTDDRDAAILELNGDLDDNIRRNVVQGLHFVGGGTGVRLLYGMYNSILGCFFHSQAAWAIEAAGERHGTGLGLISGNVLTHTRGILVRGSRETGGGWGLQIAGNIIGEDIASPAALRIERALHYGQVSVVANTFYEPRFDAIQVEDAEDVLVANNRILRPGGRGLAAERCAGLQVIGNLFRDIGLARRGESEGLLLGPGCRDAQVVANTFRDPNGSWKTAYEDRGARTVMSANVVAAGAG